jgi:predicted nucleic acid-binding protein
VTVLVDTSVWSLALRRDAPAQLPEVEELRSLLAGSDLVLTTGIIVQELLQGILPTKARATIIERFAGLTLIQPDLADHIAAADLRNTCRRAGVQLGTVDALIAQLAIRHGADLLTADQDFVHAARHVELRLWRS